VIPLAPGRPGAAEVERPGGLLALGPPGLSSVVNHSQGGLGSPATRRSIRLGGLADEPHSFPSVWHDSFEVNRHTALIVSLSVVVALGTSACSDNLPGTVTGRVVAVGGGCPAGGCPWAGTVWFTGPDTTSVSVGQDGRFQISLPAGTYTITGAHGRRRATVARRRTGKVASPAPQWCEREPQRTCRSSATSGKDRSGLAETLTLPRVADLETDPDVLFRGSPP
jgi:hypothetical protein